MPYYTAADGAKLFYQDQGAGLPVVCLSGLTRNHRDFDSLMPFLSGYRVIRPDYRGRGESDWTGPETYNLPQEAMDILALLDHLQLDKAAFIGTSRGGLIAMGLASTARNRLLGVALNDIGPVIDEAGLDAIEKYLGRAPAYQTYAEALEYRRKVMVGFANVPDERWLHDLQNSYIEAPDGLRLRYDAALREAVMRDWEITPPDLWPFFDALQGMPLALIRGESSLILSTDTVREMQKRRPDMIYANVPDRGHAPFLDEPASVKALRDWLDLLK